MADETLLQYQEEMKRNLRGSLGSIKNSNALGLLLFIHGTKSPAENTSRLYFYEKQSAVRPGKPRGDGLIVLPGSFLLINN